MVRSCLKADLRTVLRTLVWSGLGSAGVAMGFEAELTCNQRWLEQFDRYFLLAKSIEETCITQNEGLERRGLPSCGNLCTTQLMQTIERGSITVEFEFRSGGRSSGFGGSFSPSFGSFSSFSTGDFTANASTQNISVTLEIKATIPLGPTTTLECQNPLFSPIVAQLGEKIAKTAWVGESFERACVS